MKKVITLILAIAMALSLVACGSETEETTTATEVTTTEATEAAERATESAENEVWLPYDEFGQMIITDRDATGSNGAVSSSSWYATKAGLDVLEAGGNAIDAAYAVAYTLGVVEPFTSGIGGGGFMTYYCAATGEVSMLDFREVAPSAATATMWLDTDGNIKHFIDKSGKEMTSTYSQLNRLGGMAVAVPGFVAGFEQALSTWGSGSFTRSQLLESAIGYAENGYLVTPTMQSSSQDELTEISVMDELSAYYLDDFGFPPETNSTIKNQDLANTYKLIAEGGADAFYTGEVAQAIIDAVSKYDGVMTLEDLANYKAENRAPLVSTYRDYTVYAMPPSSSGGTHLIEILNILEKANMSEIPVNSTTYVHLIAEATKIAFADRAEYMADTAFTDVPLEALTSKEYASTRAAQMADGNGAYSAGEIDAGHSSTTSFSVVDSEGNMVTVTQTIGDFYGSKVAVSGYGFILNDEMYDFNLDPESVNCAEGGKRPLSCIAPTVVLNPDGSPYLTIGTPGGARIFSVVAQVIERMIDYNMDVQEAIETVRVFASDEKKLDYEEDGVNALSSDVIEALTALGYTMNPYNKLELYFGGVQAIEIKSDGTLHAGADPRRTGKALAY